MSVPSGADKNNKAAHAVTQSSSPRGQKRKFGPESTKPGSSDRNTTNKRPKVDQRAKQRAARLVSLQSTSRAFNNGAVHVDKFVKAREFEIRAFEDGIARSRKALSQRAFQQVPGSLRRRTASHNVKRIPTRLRKRARQEMLEDNTPTVTSRRRKPSKRKHLRLDTASRLRLLRDANSKKPKKGKEGVIVPNSDHQDYKPLEPNTPASKGTSTARRYQKTASLAQYPISPAKFRKRQISKSWLPTHLFHAKRAHMTPPSRPLWRFSIPLGPTAKCYRHTHRARNLSGAVAWDISYISTIGLTGRESSIKTLLKGLGIGVSEGSELATFWGNKGIKWRNGITAMSAFCHHREAPYAAIAPVMIIWCPLSDYDRQNLDKVRRKVLLRIHPSAFLSVWQEATRLAKVAKPGVMVEDLRFEIGSIEIVGPGSTEALVSALKPVMAAAAEDVANDQNTAAAQTWVKLGRITDTAFLPRDIILALDVQDPRLHHPPRTVQAPAQTNLVELLSNWPVDKYQVTPGMFERQARRTASSKMPSQKSIDRRKVAAGPGKPVAPLARDPQIPVLVIKTPQDTASTGQSHHQSWNVLLPWKCVVPVWRSLMYCPLSSGRQPRFGGIDQSRQLAFESGQPWFPADYPATQAGWEWEVMQRAERFDKWHARPKSKRLAWDKVDLGEGRKGEVGLGWACDWEALLRKPEKTTDGKSGSNEAAKDANSDAVHAPAPSLRPPENLVHVTAARARQWLSAPPASPEEFDHKGLLITVKLTLLSRGVPTTCARIYRLPSGADGKTLRRAWLSLRNSRHKPSKSNNSSLPRLPKDTPMHIIQQRLAASLLEPPRVGDERYPACPAEDDLIGFVTTGNFNLAEGQGTGIGSIMLNKVWAEAQLPRDEARLCVVRCAGTGTGRLARWDLVGL